MLSSSAWKSVTGIRQQHPFQLPDPEFGMPECQSARISLELYQHCKAAKLPLYLKDQLLRASSSICLNLGEGSAKPTAKDRLRFYHVALGSCREVQTVIALEQEQLGALHELADKLGAHLYRLCKS